MNEIKQKIELVKDTIELVLRIKQLERELVICQIVIIFFMSVIVAMTYYINSLI